VDLSSDRLLMMMSEERRLQIYVDNLFSLRAVSDGICLEPVNFCGTDKILL
jgi:hypothetical protein